ncbi:MAG: ferredoxin--NADP reductase [Flavobacteriaceae bacterium]|nr:ferredoxin--NADP reductase [Flavobacteriaceae bacterium]
MSKFEKLKIKNVLKETASAVSIVFDIPEKLKETFKFISGQYLTLEAEIKGEIVRRAYSISSVVDSTELQVAIKAVIDGVFSNYAVKKLSEGDIMMVSPPEGRFVLETSITNRKNYLGFAAGSGITPIMSMLRSVLSREPNSTFTLVYGNKTKYKTIFRKELEILKEDNKERFDIQYIYSKEPSGDSMYGRIDKTNVSYLLNNSLKGKEFDATYICGPDTMIDATHVTLEGFGFDTETIHYERFTSDAVVEQSAITGTATMTVVLDDEEETFEVDKSQTLLASSLSNHLDAPYSCQGGICASCMCKVIEGEVSMPKCDIISEEEVKEGLVLSCMARPISGKIKINYDDV